MDICPKCKDRALYTTVEMMQPSSLSRIADNATLFVEAQKCILCGYRREIVPEPVYREIAPAPVAEGAPPAKPRLEITLAQVVRENYDTLFQMKQTKPLDDVCVWIKANYAVNCDRKTLSSAMCTQKSILGGMDRINRDRCAKLDMMMSQRWATNEALAELSGVSPKTINKARNGRVVSDELYNRLMESLESGTFGRDGRGRKARRTGRMVEVAV